MATKLYLTRSEIFAAAWRRFRSMKGAKATPKQHPASWRCCLTLAWAAAKGDAGWLLAVRDDKRREDEARSRAAASHAPRGDAVEIIAISHRAANDEEQDFGQRMGDAPRLPWVFDDGKMIEQRPQARLVGENIKSKAHRGGSQGNRMSLV